VLARVAIWILLFVLGFLLTLVADGPSPLSFVLFPIPVAIAIVRRNSNFVHALFACVAMAGAAGIAVDTGAAISRDSVVLMALTATFYIFVAFVGVPLGWGILSRWPYGRIVALVTAVIFAVVLPINIVGWETIHDESVGVLDWFEGQLERQADSASTDTREQQRDAIAWLRLHNMDLFFGLVAFGTVLIGTCITLSGTSAGLRIWFGEPGPTSSFAEMRPPDWLVWSVIAVAVLYFVEQRWSEDWMRAVVWNVAFGLGVIYWLNGLSVLAFASNALQPNFVVFALVLVVIFASGFIPIFCMVGLFDTWADFRTRVTALAQARKEQADEQ